MKSTRLILGIAFLLRVIVWCGGWADPQRYLTPDSYDYLRLAETLKADGRYGTSEQPEIFRAPGYPFFLYLMHFISQSYAWIGWVQILLDTATCYLIWRLARIAFANPAAAGWTLLFQSCNVVSIVYASTLLSETLYTFVLTLFLYQMAAFNKELKSKPGQVVLLAVTGIVLTYIRAITLPYLMLPLMCLMFMRKWREAILFAMMTGAGLAPWVARNAHLTGYRGFSSVSDINLYRYNACLLSADLTRRSFAEQLNIIDSELAGIATQQGQAHYAARRGKEVIFNHPWRYAWLHLKADCNNFLPAEGDLLRKFGFQVGGNNTMSVLHTRGLFAAIDNYFQGQWGIIFWLIPGLALLCLAYLLAGVGIWRQLRDHARQPIFWLLLITLLYFMFIPGAPSHPRFRVPVAPLFSLFAGLGMVRVLERKR